MARRAQSPNPNEDPSSMILIIFVDTDAAMQLPFFCFPGQIAPVPPFHALHSSPTMQHNFVEAATVQVICESQSSMRLGPQSRRNFFNIRNAEEFFSAASTLINHTS